MRIVPILRLLLVLTLSLSWTLDARAATSEEVSSTVEKPFGQVDQDPKSGETTNSFLSVPSSVPTLQDAINTVSDGGTIEMAAGIYPAPEKGFILSDLDKSFTIRAAAGATVVIDGGGARKLFRFQNSSHSTGKPITFQGITFANGYSNSEGLAGGITIYKAQATFIDCTFRNNHSDVNTTVGGAVYAAEGSTVFFFNTLWEENSSRIGGAGLGARTHSRIYIHQSQFLRNSGNPAHHDVNASGGAINIGNSTLRVSNTLFRDNQTGAFGGAIYAIGNWVEPYSSPQSDVIVANSAFINNHAQRHATVSHNYPTEGGALTIENQTKFKIYNSRFVTNSAMIGGGISSYRADVEVYGSVFLGNRATDTTFQSGFGGAISTNSNDLTDDGTINRPASSLHVEDTLFRGRYAGVTTVAQTGGCLFAGGDSKRFDGDPGVPDMGTAAENRARVTLQRVSFLDCDVIDEEPYTSAGGAIEVTLVDLTLEDAQVSNSDALGVNGSGGGLAILLDSIANIRRTTILNNRAEKFGGGIFAQGSTIHLTDSYLVDNVVSSWKYGSAIFTGPMESRSLPARGEVANSTFSSHHGLPIFDDDRAQGLINEMRYNGNHFFHPEDDGVVYHNPIYPYGYKTVSELNDLVVAHENGTSTPKSQVDNTALGSRPAVKSLLALPPEVLPISSSGEAAPPTAAYLSYAWSGSSAALNGDSLSETAGLLETKQEGTYTLKVNSQTTSAQVATALEPSASFSATHDDDWVTLSWSVISGSFLDAAIDQGVSIASAPSGSVQVSSSNQENVYHFYAVTKEGGIWITSNSGPPKLHASDTIHVMAGLNLQVNRGVITLLNVGGGTLDWTARSNTPDLIQLESTSGQTPTSDGIPFTIKTDKLSVGDYTGSITISAGEAGTQDITIQLTVVETLYQAFLPLTKR